MAVVGSSIISKQSAPQNPLITNFSVAAANTEEEHQLTVGTRHLTLRSRNGSQIKLAFSSGGTSTDYLTIKPGAVYSEQNIDYSGKIFFQTSLSSETIEILEWF